MISLLDAAAAFDRPWPELQAWEKLRIGACLQPQRAFSPCAGYAVAAVEALGLEAMPQAMVCLSGLTGMMADVFEPARKLSDDGRLVGPEYARTSRRIHPLTLIRSLQNQVPSALSQTFGIHGPVLNALESGTALAYLLPNISVLLQSHQRLLLVLASAGDRREERAKRRCFLGTDTGREGAFAFLVGASDGLGRLDLDGRIPASASAAAGFDDPILDAGRQLLRCMIERPDERVLNFRDSLGHSAAAIWKGL